MQDLTTADFDHISGGSAATPANASSAYIDPLRVPPGVDVHLRSLPPYHGGPIHLPHVD